MNEQDRIDFTGERVETTEPLGGYRENIEGWEIVPAGALATVIEASGDGWLLATDNGVRMPLVGISQFVRVQRDDEHGDDQ